MKAGTEKSAQSSEQSSEQSEACFGPRLLEGGKAGVEFFLWAPAAKKVDVFVTLQTGSAFTVEAIAKPEGWWSASVARARIGDCYQFVIDGLAVPDPASRFNPEGPHGASQIVDPKSFEWTDAQWIGRPWHETVLYEMHIGTFTEEGSYRAASAELPRLAELGVTAIQVMPLSDFPGKFGWGYDGVLHFAPHASYGTPDELKSFIDHAHSLGLMVFMDVVYNHFGPDGNYLPSYAPFFFSEKHEGPWGRAINFDGERSETVRQFFIENAIYWIDQYHVDGLRFDAVHAIYDDSRQHMIRAIARQVRARFKGRHVHLVTEDDHNTPGVIDARAATSVDAIDGQWAGDFHHLMHVLLTGETAGYYAEYTHEPMKQLLRVLTRGVAWRGDPATKREAASDEMPLNGVVNFLQNHDQTGNRAFGERMSQLVARAHPDAGDGPIRLATALLMLAPHTPMLFMGQEWNASTPFMYFANWSGDLGKAVTEGRKKEFAHFMSAAGADLPDPCAESTFTASMLDRSESSLAGGMQWRTFFEELLELRKAQLWPALSHLRIGGHNGELVGKRGVVVRWRFDDGRVLQAALNFDDAKLKLAGDNPEGSLMYAIGNESDKSRSNILGPWSGQWRWISQAR